LLHREVGRTIFKNLQVVIVTVVDLIILKHLLLLHDDVFWLSLMVRRIFELEERIIPVDCLICLGSLWRIGYES
jgi:hypothetical protein